MVLRLSAGFEKDTRCKVTSITIASLIASNYPAQSIEQ